jgi:hypothetical protein
MTPAPVRVGTIFIPIMALPVRRCDHIANIRRQAPGFVQSFAAFKSPPRIDPHGSISLARRLYFSTYRGDVKAPLPRSHRLR